MAKRVVNRKVEMLPEGAEPAPSVVKPKAKRAPAKSKAKSGGKKVRQSHSHPMGKLATLCNFSHRDATASPALQLTMRSGRARVC